MMQATLLVVLQRLQLSSLLRDVSDLLLPSLVV
jgi:hypothetical protein